MFAASSSPGHADFLREGRHLFRYAHSRPACPTGSVSDHMPPEASFEMKCRVEVECTPLEARQFFGLPDLQPLQVTILAEVEKKLLAEMERFSPDTILKNWFSFYSQTPEQVQAFLTRLMASGTGAKTS